MDTNKKAVVSSKKRRKQMTNFKRIYGFRPEADLNKTLLSISNGRMPNVAVVVVSDLNIPILQHLETFAKESDCLSLISIKHLNHIGQHCHSNRNIQSSCYDLSDESSEGYSEFNDQLDTVRSEFDLIVTVGERYDGNYYNNRMPVLEYEDTPVVHLINCVNEEELESLDWEYENTIAIPRLFIDEVAEISPQIDFVDYEQYFNLLCAKLIQGALEEMKKEIRQKRSWRDSVELSLNLFELTDKTIKESYRQMQPMLVGQLPNIY